MVKLRGRNEEKRGGRGARFPGSRFRMSSAILAVRALPATRCKQT